MNSISLKLQRTRKIILVVMILCSSLVQASPFVTTFINTTDINIHLELHFSDNSIATKGIALSQSYQVVNFDNKTIVSVIFNSPDKDKKGNAYGQLDKKFTTPVADTTYNIALQVVPAHEVPAGPGTDAFKMPDSQTIMCDIAPKVATSVIKKA